MALYVFVFLLVVCLLLLLVRRGVWTGSIFSLPPHRAGQAQLTPRLLKPRCPDDCPACGLASLPSSAREPAHAPVRRLSRGQKPARSPQTHPHRGLRLSEPAVCVLREHRCALPRGFSVMASMDKPSASRPFGVRRAAPRSRARRNTPLYRLKTPSQQIAVVRITRWPRGSTLPRLRGSSAFDTPRSPPG